MQGQSVLSFVSLALLAAATNLNPGSGAYVQVLHQHLKGLCADIQNHTITDVQTNERVSLLLKDSFIGSFPPKERDFIKEFVETQMFEVYCDCIIK